MVSSTTKLFCILGFSCFCLTKGKFYKKANKQTNKIEIHQTASWKNKKTAYKKTTPYKGMVL